MSKDAIITFRCEKRFKDAIDTLTAKHDATVSECIEWCVRKHYQSWVAMKESEKKEKEALISDCMQK